MPKCSNRSRGRRRDRPRRSQRRFSHKSTKSPTTQRHEGSGRSIGRNAASRGTGCATASHFRLHRACGCAARSARGRPAVQADQTTVRVSCRPHVQSRADSLCVFVSEERVVPLWLNHLGVLQRVRTTGLTADLQPSIRHLNLGLMIRRLG